MIGMKYEVILFVVEIRSIHPPNKWKKNPTQITFQCNVSPLHEARSEMIDDDENGHDVDFALDIVSIALCSMASVILSEYACNGIVFTTAQRPPLPAAVPLISLKLCLIQLLFAKLNL